MTTCAREGCERPAKTRGYCKGHYVNEMKAGRMKARTEVERFWSKVDASGCCWQWTAAVAGRYGQFTVSQRDRRPAHRYAWELLVGPIPHGMQLDHLCRNARCVNPDHLEVVDGRTNILRSAAPSALNARKTHCKNGHNDWTTYRGSRVCRTCKNAYYRARRRAA